MNFDGQKERLMAAAVEVTARYGYRGASVARIVAEAGASRATFYAHFEDKEDCFLAVYRVVAARVLRDARQVAETEPGPDGLRRILTKVLENADREPAVAKVFLIDSLAAGSMVREEHEQLLEALEGLIDRYLDRPVEGLRLQIPARSMFGGVASLIAMRVFKGETGRLIELRDDLEAWLRSYSIPAAEKRLDLDAWAAMGRDFSSPVALAPSPLDQRLPRGRGALSSAVVASEQRRRVLAAVARVARIKGYEAMTVADIVATAGIAREAFYRHFRGKEDAFLEAQAHALETSISMAAAKFFAEEAWRDRVWSAALPMLEYMASVPDLACLDFLESYSLGGAAVRRSFESRMAYTLFLEEGYRLPSEAERPPHLSSEAIAGAVLELLRRQAVRGRVDRLPELLPQAVYVILAPFIGPTAALELVSQRLARTAGPEPT